MARYVLITGATGGLGRAFAWEFAARGWDLFLTDRDRDRDPLELLAYGLERAHGVGVRFRAADLSDEAVRSDLIAELTACGSGFGALVNVAGFDLEGSFAEKEWAGLLSLMRVNMEAGVRLTHALVGMHSTGEQLRVINTASLAAYFPMPYKALYAASKGFVLSASLALREELRGRATITVLCPAGMPTTPECIEAIAAQGTLGRITTVNTSEVVRVTYEAAMRGRPVVVPGAINRAVLAVSRLVPRTVVAALIARRWGSLRGYAASDPVRRLEGARPSVAPPSKRSTDAGNAPRRAS